jgi:hypothetical protein
MTTYTPADERRLLEIRKTIIIAIASDDALMERLILKGGNALDIVYKLGERASLDVDFSMARDFEDADDLAEMRDRLFSALRDRFDTLGYVVFDEKIVERPPVKPGQQPGVGITIWGGYNATFKLISKERYRDLGGQPGVPSDGRILNALRMQSQVTGPDSERSFIIEISKFEYTEGRVMRSVDNYDCYVYTPAMIAAEKLRAICQQLPDYKLRRNPAPRPRDFFDIHTIATRLDCDITAPEHHDLMANMFRVKKVPLEFLGRIGAPEHRAFHAQQWGSVTNAVRGRTEPFDFYFDFVVDAATRLLAAMA